MRCASHHTTLIDLLILHQQFESCRMDAQSVSMSTVIGYIIQIIFEDPIAYSYTSTTSHAIINDLTPFVNDKHTFGEFVISLVGRAGGGGGARGAGAGRRQD